MMDATFFRDVNQIDIQNGQFVLKTGPDYSRRMVHHHHATTVNDRSRHTTNVGSYKNYGQHADGNGQINNYGSQTTNNGAVYGYRQYATNAVPNSFHNPGPNGFTPPSSDDEVFDDDDFHPSARGQSDRSGPGDRKYYNHSPAAMQAGPPLGNTRATEAGHPRTEKERPNPPRKQFDPKSPQFKSEYESMSPQMKAYLRNLGFNRDPEGSLDEEMANVSLEDPPLQRSHSPESFGRQTPEVLRKGKHYVLCHPPASYDSDEDEDDEGEADYDSGFRQYASSYTHNDNRVITKNVNSNNVNTENVVDSYNDNSTRTDIKKNSAR